jgi:hypothetical protein
LLRLKYNTLRSGQSNALPIIITEYLKRSSVVFVHHINTEPQITSQP